VRAREVLSRVLVIVAVADAMWASRDGCDSRRRETVYVYGTDRRGATLRSVSRGYAPIFSTIGKRSSRDGRTSLTAQGVDLLGQAGSGDILDC
jgi:hypothetical protein